MWSHLPVLRAQGRFPYSFGTIPELSRSVVWQLFSLFQRRLLNVSLVRSLPVSARVEIYTTDYCGYCTRAKALLASKGVDVIEIRAGSDPEKRREMIQRSQGGMTFPQVFINGRPVGGSDDI